MIRNGYTRTSSGLFTKLVVCPNGKQSGNGVNHCVERITRNRLGWIVKAERQNQHRS